MGERAGIQEWELRRTCMVGGVSFQERRARGENEFGESESTENSTATAAQKNILITGFPPIPPIPPTEIGGVPCPLPTTLSTILPALDLPPTLTPTEESGDPPPFTSERGEALASTTAFPLAAEAGLPIPVETDEWVEAVSSNGWCNPNAP